MPRKSKPEFSKVKAVKLNARERLGTPPPERVLADPKARALAKPKHKQSLAKLFSLQAGPDSEAD